MTGEHAVGRVIARPFTGAPGAFERTEGRRDFALAPPSRSYLQELSRRGRADARRRQDLRPVRRASASADRTRAPPTRAALASAAALLEELDGGLVFVNLIETDQVYGHRKDIARLSRRPARDRRRAGRWLPRLRAGDLLIVTADHGVDPAHPGDRPHARVRAAAGRHRGDAQAPSGAPRTLWRRRHDGPLADVGATVLRWLTGRERATQLPGEAFLS